MSEPLFNDDPAWLAYVASLEPTLRKIAQKLSSSDMAMQEDCLQEARMALLTVRAENIRGNRNAFCSNVARNSMLSYLASYRTGPWDAGRTTSNTNRTTGVTTKAYAGPRFASYEQLTELGLQVDEKRNVSWARRDSLEGLENETAREQREKRETFLNPPIDKAPPTEKAPVITSNPSDPMATTEPSTAVVIASKPVNHGTYRYSKHKCRCDVCVTANRAAQRAQYKRRAERQTAALAPMPENVAAPNAPKRRRTQKPAPPAPTICAGLMMIWAAITGRAA